MADRLDTLSDLSALSAVLLLGVEGGGKEEDKEEELEEEEGLVLGWELAEKPFVCCCCFDCCLILQEGKKKEVSQTVVMVYKSSPICNGDILYEIYRATHLFINRLAKKDGLIGRVAQKIS